MTIPYVENFQWRRRRALKYRVGDERMESLVLYSSTVTPDDRARRVLSPATILCEITSGLGAGKYGPYDKTASDGRQTIGTANQPFVLLVGYDVTLGDRSVEGLWMDCVFNWPEIVAVNGLSDNATQKGLLKAAFPQCAFR